MIDWEDIVKAENAEELREAKLWLFKENMRLENERAKLEKEKSELQESADNFQREQIKMKQEMEELSRRTILERKRLKEENLFFDKKMAILQDGFRHLEEDRRNFEREKKSIAEERERSLLGLSDGGRGSEIGEALFRSANNPLGLKKRYKDLIKIFHPDNLFGDDELSQIINREFQKRRRED